MFDRPDGKTIGLLRVQVQQQKRRLSVLVPGKITQKRKHYSDIAANETTRKIRQAIQRFQWELVPRGRIATAFSFHATDHGVPDLHNLVKFYLDLLIGNTFHDDRQVAYLVAECYRPNQATRPSIFAEGSVRITVERLRDYQRKLALYIKLLEFENFQEFLKAEPKLINDLMNEGDEEEEDWHFLSQETLATLGVSQKSISELRDFETKLIQQQLLARNRIDPQMQRNGDYNRLHNSASESVSHFEPFTIYLGDLPRKGEKQLYKLRISERLRHLHEHLRFFGGHIRIPIEVDVQVFPRRGSVPEKDLDNIMRDIGPALKEELFAGNAYLHGYRIYITRCNDNDLDAGNIRVKLLAANTIRAFHERVDRVLSAAKGWLDTLE